MRRTSLRLCVCVALTLLVARQASAALVNSAEKEDYGGSSAATCALPATSLTAGNLIFVGLRATTSSDLSLATVGDTAGNTYVFIDTNVSGTHHNAAFYAKNVTGHATNVVTVDLDGADTMQFYACESLQYSTLDTGSVLDTSAKGLATGATSVTTGAFTTSQADVQAVCHLGEAGGGGTFTAGTGYTLRTVDSLNASGSEDQLFASVQTGQTASVTHSSTTTLSIICGFFKVAGGAPAPRSRIIGGGVF